MEWDSTWVEFVLSEVLAVYVEQSTPVPHIVCNTIFIQYGVGLYMGRVCVV